MNEKKVLIVIYTFYIKQKPKTNNKLKLLLRFCDIITIYLQPNKNNINTIVNSSDFLKQNTYTHK